jgi:site-specific DNA-cytosine methylase
LLNITNTLKTNYEVQWRILDTKHNGLPQRRKRLYIIGIRLDLTTTTDGTTKHFAWPETIQNITLDDILAPIQNTDDQTNTPPPSETTAHRNVHNAQTIALDHHPARITPLLANAKAQTLSEANSSKLALTSSKMTYQNIHYRTCSTTCTSGPGNILAQYHQYPQNKL